MLYLCASLGENEDSKDEKSSSSANRSLQQQPRSLLSRLEADYVSSIQQDAKDDESSGCQTSSAELEPRSLFSRLEADTVSSTHQEQNIEMRINRLEQAVDRQTQKINDTLEKMRELQSAMCKFSDAQVHVARRIQDVDVKVAAHEDFKESVQQRLGEFEVLLLTGSSEIDKCLKTVQEEHQQARNKLQTTTLTFESHMRTSESWFEHLIKMLEQAMSATANTNDIDERLRGVQEQQKLTRDSYLEIVSLERNARESEHQNLESRFTDFEKKVWSMLDLQQKRVLETAPPDVSKPKATGGTPTPGQRSIPSSLPSSIAVPVLDGVSLDVNKKGKMVGGSAATGQCSVPSSIMVPTLQRQSTSPQRMRSAVAPQILRPRSPHPDTTAESRARSPPPLGSVIFERGSSPKPCVINQIRPAMVGSLQRDTSSSTPLLLNVSTLQSLLKS